MIARAKRPPRMFSAGKAFQAIVGRYVLALCHLAFILLGGCATPRGSSCPPSVPCSVQSWTSPTVTSTACPCEFVIPPGVSLEDTVSEDEAIATALANNAAFRAALTQLGMAQGDVVQAGLLTNPNLVHILPVGVKQWEWTLYMPLETFVLRPQRLAIAERDYQRVANSLVQTGLNLVRDVRVAHAELALAIDQAKLAAQTVEIRKSIADLTEQRLQRGDISELEASTAKIDTLNAEANAAVVDQNVNLARARLAALMGLPPSMNETRADSLEAVPPIKLNEAELIERAIVSRPDMQAAEWAISSAMRREKLSHWLFWRIDGGLDANGEGKKGFEIGPALRFDIPIFNRNQGGITRAQAEVMQARYNRDALRDQIVLEVRTATTQLRQSQDNLKILRERIVPSMQEASAIAQKAYDGGGDTYLLVLLTSTQYIDARVREFDQVAATRRAFAELERGAGRKIAVESDPWTDLPILLSPPKDDPPAAKPE